MIHYESMENLQGALISTRIMMEETQTALISLYSLAGLAIPTEESFIAERIAEEANRLAALHRLGRDINLQIAWVSAASLGKFPAIPERTLASSQAQLRLA